jgi:hypothetical protein
MVLLCSKLARVAHMIETLIHSSNSEIQVQVHLHLVHHLVHMIEVTTHLSSLELHHHL